MRSDRETLLNFLVTHYDDVRANRLTKEVGMEWGLLPGSDAHARWNTLLLRVEREGMAAALLACLERDFTTEVPSLAWAGAWLGRPDAVACPPSSSLPAGGLPAADLPFAESPTAPPAAAFPVDRNDAFLKDSFLDGAPEEDALKTVAPVDGKSIDGLAIDGKSIDGKSIDERSIQSPLLRLQDGVEALEAARRRLHKQQIAAQQAFPDAVRTTPDGHEEGEAADPHKPFRFVHGYTLPAHWAQRDQEISELVDEVRTNRHGVLALIAIGGTGKSALTRKLLDELPRHQVPLDGALWFSFYVEPEFDRFLTEACYYLIPDFDPRTHPSPYEKGVMLREAMETGHYLLVLDGIEVLLVADRARKDYGAFHDRALREFLEGVCEGSASQVLISSRIPLTDLQDNENCRVLELADLSLDAADELLFSYGVQGSQADRTPIYTRFGSHALTLQILGDYLIRYHQGDARGLLAIPNVAPDAPQGIRLQAVLDGYWQRLQPDERFFLTRMSAFRGGVEERSLIVLNKTGDIFNREFRTLVQHLLKSPLLSVERRDGHARLTAHPLIKTFFYERMADNERDQTHRALKDYAQGLPVPERPRTLEDYEPLLEACHHCLQVGLYTEAYQIYRRNNMDNALRWWGHYAQAHALLEPLREATLGDVPAWKSERWQRSWVENETALLAVLRGDTEQAIARFESSVALDTEAGDASGESASWQNLASVLTQRGQFQSALGALEKSRALEAILGRYEKEDMLAGLEGICRMELGQERIAFDLLSRAVAISTQHSHSRAVCYWTWRLGDLALRAGEPQEAQHIYQKALAMAQHEQFRDYEGYALHGLGDAAQAQGDLPYARIRLTEALRLARTLGNPYLENEVRLSGARLAESENQLAEAQGQAQQVLARAQACGYLVQLAEAYLILARCARQSRDSDACANYLALVQPLLSQTNHRATYLQCEALTQTLSVRTA